MNLREQERLQNNEVSFGIAVSGEKSSANLQSSQSSSTTLQSSSKSDDGDPVARCLPLSTLDGDAEVFEHIDDSPSIIRIVSIDANPSDNAPMEDAFSLLISFSSWQMDAGVSEDMELYVEME